MALVMCTLLWTAVHSGMPNANLAPPLLGTSLENIRIVRSMKA